MKKILLMITLLTILTVENINAISFFEKRNKAQQIHQLQKKDIKTWVAKINEYMSYELILSKDLKRKGFENKWDQKQSVNPIMMQEIMEILVKKKILNQNHKIIQVNEQTIKTIQLPIKNKKVKEDLLKELLIILQIKEMEKETGLSIDEKSVVQKKEYYYPQQISQLRKAPVYEKYLRVHFSANRSVIKHLFNDIGENKAPIAIDVFYEMRTQEEYKNRNIKGLFVKYNSSQAYQQSILSKKYYNNSTLKTQRVDYKYVDQKMIIGLFSGQWKRDKPYPYNYKKKNIPTKVYYLLGIAYLKQIENERMKAYYNTSTQNALYPEKLTRKSKDKLGIYIEGLVNTQFFHSRWSGESSISLSLFESTSILNIAGGVKYKLPKINLSTGIKENLVFIKSKSMHADISLYFKFEKEFKIKKKKSS